MTFTENWNDYAGKVILLPMFTYPDGIIRPLLGKCRGFGAISDDKKLYEDTIGIYTQTGVCFNIKIDRRVKGDLPTFGIGGTGFTYPIVACSAVKGGMPIIDPATGIVKNSKDWEPCGAEDTLFEGCWPG